MRVRLLSIGSITVASEAYHDWSGEAADAQLRMNFTLKLLLSQNFCNRPLMRFISFASNIGPAAAVPAGPAPAPLSMPPTKVCPLCKAAVPVRRKTRERCDLVFRKAECNLREKTV